MGIPWTGALTRVSLPMQYLLQQVGIHLCNKKKLGILKNVSGIINPVGIHPTT